MKLRVKQISHPTYADNEALPAFARRCCNSRSLSPPGPRSEPAAAGLLLWPRAAADRRTVGRTDTVPFRRPCTAYCTGGVDKRWVCWWFRSANRHELASYSSNWRQQPGGKSPSGTACIVGEHASVVLSVRCPLHNSQPPLAPTATDSPLFSTSARRRLP